MITFLLLLCIYRYVLSLAVDPTWGGYQLYNEELSVISANGWTESGVSKETFNSNCPDGSGFDACWRISGGFSRGSFKKTFNVVGYQDIYVFFKMSQVAVDTTCDLIISDVDGNGTTFAYSTSQMGDIWVLSVPSRFDNYPLMELKFTNSACCDFSFCFIDDVIIYGFNPTITPSLNPTLNPSSFTAPPTLSPSSNPAPSPTNAHAPTRNPTRAPMIMPTNTFGNTADGKVDETLGTRTRTIETHFYSSADVTVFIILLVTLVLVFVIVIGVVLYKKKKQKEEFEKKLSVASNASVQMHKFKVDTTKVIATSPSLSPKENDKLCEIVNKGEKQENIVMDLVRSESEEMYIDKPHSIDDATSPQGDAETAELYGQNEGCDFTEKNSEV